jgi:ribonuclease HI
MITIYFDGLCYPKNPGGVAAYGYLVYRDGEPIWRGFGGVGEGRGSRIRSSSKATRSW